MSELKIVYGPSVYLVGKQMIDEDAVAGFLIDEDCPDWNSSLDASGGETLIELGGRLCYMSFSNPRPGGTRAYIKHILEVGHGSVCEHAVYSLVITGVSRSLTHELVRHRAGMSYSQLSQRYVDHSEWSFVVPFRLTDDVLHQTEKGMAWVANCEQALRRYRRVYEDCVSEAKEEGFEEAQAAYDPGQCPWKDADEWLSSRTQEVRTAIRKEARGTARSALPECTETKIMVTANGRALRHFIEMRASRHADVEIRRLANAVWEALKEDSPLLFGDYVPEKLPDGTLELSTPFRKV